MPDVAYSPGMVPRIDLRDWSGYDDTGSNDMASTLQSAVVQLEAVGTGYLFIPDGNFVLDSSITIRGGDPTLAGGYQGGIALRGSHMAGTKITSTATKAFVIDVGADPSGSNGAQAMIELRDMHIIGPGADSAGSVLIDWSPQGEYQNTPNALLLDHLWLDDAETLARFDDTTNLWITYSYFLNYVKGLRLGFNHDTLRIIANRWGNNVTELGSQTETAIAWDFISPRFPAATTLGGAQNHLIESNWFMRQALVADIWDPSAANITFRHNQFESCKHYAQIGNSSTTQAPSRIVFDQNTFMRVDNQDETQAKFLFPNTGAAGSLKLTDNVCDSSTGPKYGWVQCGTASNVRFENNALPVNGAYVVEANHLIVGASGKKVVLSSGETYEFRTSGSGGATRTRQFNASGNDGYPDESHYAYNSTDSTIFRRWGMKAAASDTASGNALDIIQRSVSGTRYAMLSGAHVPLQASSLPTASANLRGMVFHVQGGTGVADTYYVCMKKADDTYAWVLCLTAP